MTPCTCHPGNTCTSASSCAAARRVEFGENVKTTTAMPELPEPELGYIETDKSRQPAFSARQMRAALQAQPEEVSDEPTEAQIAAGMRELFAGPKPWPSWEVTLKRVYQAMFALRPQSESEARRAAQEQLYTERERHTAEVKRLQTEIGRLKSERPQAAPVGFDVEAMIRSVLPGGNYCDPQAVADAIRDYVAASPQAVPMTDEVKEQALDLLATMFDAYENGVPCHEDDGGYIGMAFSLDNETFHACAGILNAHRPKAHHSITAQGAQGEQA